jgi:TRAP-type mannitol/chloroaromatic compound transport system permease small subunit
VSNNKLFLNALNKIAASLESMSEKTGVVVSWLTTGLVLIVCYDVFTRYIIGRSSIAIQELEWHLFAVIFLLGAPFTLKHDKHVRVDVLYMRFSPKKQAWIDLVGSLIFLIPFSTLIVITSWKFAMNSLSIGETSPDPGGLPMRYILKMCIPLGFTLLGFQGLALASRSLMTLLSRDINRTVD